MMGQSEARAQTCRAVGHDTSVLTFKSAQHNVLDITEDVSLGIAGTTWQAIHLVKCELQAAAILH